METTNYKNLKNHELTELERKGLFRRWHYMPSQMAVSKIELFVLYTKDQQFAAVQIFRYSDYDFKPNSDIFIYKGADAEAFLSVLKELKPEG